MRNTSEEDLRTMRETMKSVLAESLLPGTDILIRKHKTKILAGMYWVDHFIIFHKYICYIYNLKAKTKKTKTAKIEVIPEPGPSGDSNTEPSVEVSIEPTIVPGKESWQSGEKYCHCSKTTGIFKNKFKV